jgi:hypothetical protein
MARNRSATSPSTEWYIDSGATDHFTGSKAAFLSYETTHPFPVTLGDESNIMVEGKGSIILATSIGYHIQLNDVLYSPQFKDTSLLSIPKITQAGTDITFSSSKAHLINEGTTIATGTYSPAMGLYHLDQSPPARALKTGRAPDPASLELWH